MPKFVREVYEDLLEEGQWYDEDLRIAKAMEWLMHGRIVRYYDGVCVPDKNGEKSRITVKTREAKKAQSKIESNFAIQDETR